jgi:hypothetical protein
MTAAGEAVLALAYGEVGTQDGSKYWAWYGADLGSYCACFVSYCGWHAGYPVCPIDSQKGFVLVSNGTVHSYENGEANPTLDLQPGDVILFSWYSWQWENGLPIITDPEWAGWVAGDHTGLFSHWIDQGSGQFATVEGNTSGGVVAARSDRYTSQVCGWWRPPSMEGAWPPDPTVPPTGSDDDMYQTCLVTTAGHPWNGSVFMCAGGRAMGMNDGALVADLQGRGLAGPTINVEAWTIYGCYEVVYPSGPGAVPG